MAAAASTLETLVSSYRREGAARPASGLELEIRFQALDAANFQTILQALNSKKLGASVPIGEGTITHTVDAIMVEERQPRGADASERTLRPQRVRQLRFEDGVRTGEKFVYKE